MQTTTTSSPSLYDLLKSEVERYLGNEITLSQFNERFGPIFWDVENHKDTEAEELAYDIELLLAEFSQGYYNEMELRDQLLALSRVGGQR